MQSFKFIMSNVRRMIRNTWSLMDSTNVIIYRINIILDVGASVKKLLKGVSIYNLINELIETFKIGRT